MKLLGGIILMVGMVMILISILAGQGKPLNDEGTSKRIALLGWGALVSFIGIFVAFYKEFNGR